MSVRVGNTLISPLVNNGGGSILTITITPQQGGYDSFTWSGATTQQIADAFAAGTTIKLNYGSDGVYDVDQLRTFTSGANINVIATYLADYNTTIETQLFYDGTGEQFDTDFYTDSQVDNLLAGKQDALTAGTGISLSNNTLAIDTSVVATQSDLPTSNQLTAASAAYSAQYLVSNIYKNQAGTAYNMARKNMQGGISLESTLIEPFDGATASVAGGIGLVPKPSAGDDSKYLKGDGTWATPPGTTYTAGTNVQISNNNVISATDTTYTAGTGISISNNVISATGTGSTPLILTITPDQQTEGNFTWTGATIEEIHTTFDSGAEVLISVSGTVYRVTAVRYTTTVAELSVAVDAIHTLALRLYPNGQGESLEITLVYSETLAAALATKQNTLTAGDGISITNGVISCTFANGNGVSY